MDAMFVLAPVRFDKHTQSQLKVSLAQPDQAWCIFFLSSPNQLPISRGTQPARRKLRLTVRPELVKHIETPLSLSSPECCHTAV